MNPDPQAPPSLPRKVLRTKIIGVGSAGGNIVQAVSRLHPQLAVATANTDSRALQALDLSEKVVLGGNQTRGWGAGGDPLLGKAAAEADRNRIRALCHDVDLVFLVAGMGGGTGTGATPIFIEEAREAGASVLCLVLTPFEFEGRRRALLAQDGVSEISERIDGIISLSNESLLRQEEEETIEQTLLRINQHVARALVQLNLLLVQSGLVHLDFSDIVAATRNGAAESFLFSASAEGTERAQTIVEDLAQHILLEPLAAKTTVCLVGITAGSGLKMAEVRMMVDAVSSLLPQAQVLMGTALEESRGDRVELIVLAALDPASAQIPSSSKGQREGLPSNSAKGTDNQWWTEAKAQRPPSRFVAPAPEMSAEEKAKYLSTQRSGVRPPRKPDRLKQATLGLEIVSRGRFEKSEPTLHQGQDLDVPTYIRRGIPLN